MRAEIIAIGNELTSGARLDTNSQWLSLELAELGIRVQYHTTIDDDLPALVAEMRSAVNRSDLVLITGGLGPTLDDLTRQAMAELAQVPLVLDVEQLAIIESMFSRRNRPMAERNRIQAMFPEGSEPISNPRGTAPGIWQQVGRKGQPEPCVLAAMPGVPSEMKRMFREEIRPRLPGGETVIRRARINCFGIGESDAEARLGELTARGREPEIGITVHEATITLRINAHGPTEEACQAQIEQARREIHERMGTLVFSEEDDELQHVVIRQLAAAGLTLATAECGTGGLLAERLTDVENYEAAYRGGLVLTRDGAGWELLGIPSEQREAAGNEVAAGAMARGCREKFGTDFALAVTERPAYDVEQESGQVPALYLALAGENLLTVREQVLVGDAAIARSRAAKGVLDLLRRHLQQQDEQKTG
ncbi:MAG: CinA family nicotinamide mononucleotide deamidase-related protein [Planctomycetaceae bacterium]|nr:CinA family nicotinamide mononucleotide deamidase-related protein [Planctomycetaceae bacterium]